MTDDYTSWLPHELQDTVSGTRVWRLCLAPAGVCVNSGTFRLTNINDPFCPKCRLRMKVVCGWAVRKPIYVAPAHEDDDVLTRCCSFLWEWIVTFFVRPYAFGLWFDNLWSPRYRATASRDVCLPIFGAGTDTLLPGCPDCGGVLDHDLLCSEGCGIELVKLSKDDGARTFHRCPRHPRGGKRECESGVGIVDGWDCSCRHDPATPGNIKIVRDGDGWRVSCLSCKNEYSIAKRALVRAEDPGPSSGSTCGGHVAVLEDGGLIGTALGDRVACEADAMWRAATVGARRATTGSSYQEVDDETVERAQAALDSHAAPRLLERLRFRREPAGRGSDVFVRTGSRCLCVYETFGRPAQDECLPDPQCRRCAGSGRNTEDQLIGDVPDTVGLVGAKWDPAILASDGTLAEAPPTCPDCRDGRCRVLAPEVTSELSLEADSNPRRCDTCGALWNVVEATSA